MSNKTSFCYEFVNKKVIQCWKSFKEPKICVFSKRRYEEYIYPVRHWVKNIYIYIYIYILKRVMHIRISWDWIEFSWINELFSPWYDFFLFFLNLKLLILYWGITDWQCCGTFRWTASGLSHTYTCINSLSTPLFHPAKSLQSCPTLCDPIDGSPPGSSIHGILQARVLEWGAIAFSTVPSMLPHNIQQSSMCYTIYPVGYPFYL